jgi:hypothetical protein
MLHGLWMVVATDNETMRLPADWMVTEPAPVEVPTESGPVDLRAYARAAGSDDVGSVTVDDGLTQRFTVSFVRA